MQADSYNNDITDGQNFRFDDDNDIIKVIGVGGGGSNAVNYMYKQNIPNVKFVVLNTDKQHLELSPVPEKLILGYDITQGRGAGNVPDVGRQCAEASEQDIRHLFEDNTEMVFITAGMGGGTGTGAAPVVARIAKEMGMLTIGIVTVPFIFEGERKIMKALDGAEEMKKHVDALLVINNENLVELYKDYTIFNAFHKADETLANAARSISEIISEHCFINVDFQDVKTILKDSGTAIISTAIGEGEHRISDAIQNSLHSPLLKAHDIKTSKRLLFKFSCSQNCDNPLRAEEITEITEFTATLPSTIDVKWGVADVPELGDKVKVTVLASGFDVTLREGTAAKRIVVSGGGDLLDTAEEETVIFDEPREARHDAAKKRMEEVYGSETVAKKIRTAAKMRYAVLQPEQFDDHEVIALIERNPTYARDSRFNDTLREASEHRQPQRRHDAPSSETAAITFGDIDD